jgi:hypothetical protein
MYYYCTRGVEAADESGVASVKCPLFEINKRDELLTAAPLAFPRPGLSSDSPLLSVRLIATAP